MPNLISAIVDPLKSAGETAQRLMEVRDGIKLSDTVIELQAQIMAAQQGAFAAQERETAMTQEIGQLKKRMAELETWEAEKQRYQLTDFGGETFAYALKPGMEKGEPAHRLCAACFQKKQKSILQFSLRNGFGQDVFTCPACKVDFEFGTIKRSPVQTVAKTDYDPHEW